ncbi:uncharacterized protein LOC110831330 isoform X2 [Zootermopsis nevadensis]|uniref:uncharacterized protein LOC110831330 isoform X2 n=1 Tax=Zootermopsis nevadensis TaxID=136037 RepID=UPI000B8EAAAF|nr:uncharacterized protein LOC110831330 isoform X2 [Zootermopsis nevadensis]
MITKAFSFNLNIKREFVVRCRLNATLREVSFFFHPCSNVPYGHHTGSDDCSSGSSLCLFNKTSNTFQNLGTTEDNRFLFGNLKDSPVILYKHGNITTGILLQCVYRTRTSFTVIGVPDEEVTHKLRLESKWACPAFELRTDKTISQNSDEGLSTGSVLVIIFFVFTILYFVGGAVALRLLRGAEGRELIPNYDFWVDLPNLVRDGMTFVLSGCQTTPSYDRI